LVFIRGSGPPWRKDFAFCEDRESRRMTPDLTHQ